MITQPLGLNGCYFLIIPSYPICYRLAARKISSSWHLAKYASIAGSATDCYT